MENLISKLNPEILSILIMGISFSISYLMMPKLIGVIRFKKLMDNPNERSSHLDETPTLAGIVFFVSLIICIFFIHYYDPLNFSINIITALTILLIIGLKDDLVLLSAKSKVVAQLVATTFILLNSEIYITNFHGFLGIYEIPLIATIAFSYLYMIFIINAYNLIDGIDGLAGVLGIIAFSIFAIFFYKLELIVYFLLAITCIGFLAAFLRFNLSKKNKIFMGDTGSMIVGFLLGLSTLRFLSLDPIQLEQVHVRSDNVFLIAISILFFPVIDVVRVIIVRLLNKTGPFTPDRRHLHHVFIDKGLPHVRASLTLAINSIIAFLMIYFANIFLTHVGLMIFFVVSTFIAYYILLLLDIDSTARVHRKKIKSFIPEKIYNLEFWIRKRIIIVLKKLFYRDLL